MHNDDTTLVIVENDNSEDITINHIDDIATMIEKEKRLQNSDSEETEEERTPQKLPMSEKGEIAENFVVIRRNEKDFVHEFLTEYKRCLQKRFPKQLQKLKYKWTRKAVEETLNLLFDRYSITKK